MTKVRFYPEDIIAIIFSFLVFLTQIYLTISGSYLISVEFYLLPFSVLILIILIRLDGLSDSKTLRFLRTYYHIPLYAFVFSAFQSIVHILNPIDKDNVLLEWDYLIFGLDLTLWFEKFTSPILTEILTIGYFSYYILPSLTFIVLFFSLKGKSVLISRMYLLAIVTGWYLALIFYVVFPAAGPDIAFAQNYKIPIEGISPFVNFYLENLSRYLRESNVRNTFPSLHFGIILITAYFSFIYKRKLFFICAMPLGLLLTVATVYLRQHYAVDLIAAIPVAVLSIWIGVKGADEKKF